MRKFAIAAAMCAACANAHAAIAYWTGQMRFVTTVTYQQGVSCEYRYVSSTFWRTFVGATCPPSVEVQ